MVCLEAVCRFPHFNRLLERIKYVLSGSLHGEYLITEDNSEKFDKDIELMKIQAHISFNQGFFFVYASFVLSFFLALVILVTETTTRMNTAPWVGDVFLAGVGLPAVVQLMEGV